MSTKIAAPEMEAPGDLNRMTPREIVAELDKHVVGQKKAKRAVAIALRNRIRRQKLSAELAQEVLPRNIIMIGSTGVGKTEIARRLARLSNSPFIKIEASKFTEVGYVGRDVEAIIRDLVEIAIDKVRSEKARQIEDKAESNAEERLLDLLLPPMKKPSKSKKGAKEKGKAGNQAEDQEESDLTGSRRNSPDSQDGKEDSERFQRTREKLRKRLREGQLDQRMVEIDVYDRPYPPLEIFTGQGWEEMDFNMREMLPGYFGGRGHTRKMTVEEAYDYLILEEENKLIDMEQVTREALEQAEESGIVFLDEIDKVAGRESGHGPEVSREGVQRDILPIVEGTTVSTRYGMVRTDHILFIAAGAFHVSKPSDLIPELQGRFPIRVELDSLNEEDFVRILTEPRNALVTQYVAMMATEDLDLTFTEDAVAAVARYASQVNKNSEDIGARRLYTIMEALMEEISFSSPDMKRSKLTIDGRYVRKQLAAIVRDEDLSRYIL
ncbi:MAG TPA: ATP-dependent protease ATPase subunit HslU [Acidobacteriota bacterium]|nr:ATP-dependent protease ATPase subunit HslU [Acidobacteriota bacterium]